MPSSANKIKLGELLIDAGIITSGDLTEAIQVSRRLGVPIGQALLVSRCVTDNVLEAALEAQPLVKDGTITRQAAVDALRKSYEEGSPLRDFLEFHEGTSEDSQQTSKRLAELLLDSEIVTQDQVDQALMTSFSSGMPLGSALVLEGVLSPSLFPSILRIQRNIREGKVGRQEGISELRSTFLHWIKAEESLARQHEIEGSGEVYSQAEIEEAIHSFVAPEYAEHASNIIPPSSPAPAAAPQVQPPQPAPRPVQPPRDPVVIEQPAPVASNEPARLFDVLKDSGNIKPSDLQSAFEKILDDPIASGKLFILLGLTDENVVKNALKSQPHLSKYARKDDAINSISAKAGENGSNEEDDENEEAKAQREFARARRKAISTKVLGGIAVGAAVAGLSSLFRPKR
ncbi:MAG: hypothetical protein SGJ27_01090 [Candidatus Melainabacteria bacterium]|nr:hypothetical protein [Candidatus Melainabacteria bacterium]